jgi:hypothetical protein
MPAAQVILVRPSANSRESSPAAPSRFVHEDSMPAELLTLVRPSHSTSRWTVFLDGLAPFENQSPYDDLGAVRDDPLTQTTWEYANEMSTARALLMLVLGLELKSLDLPRRCWCLRRSRAKKDCLLALARPLANTSTEISSLQRNFKNPGLRRFNASLVCFSAVLRRTREDLCLRRSKHSSAHSRTRGIPSPAAPPVVAPLNEKRVLASLVVVSSLRLNDSRPPYDGLGNPRLQSLLAPLLTSLSSLLSSLRSSFRPSLITHRIIPAAASVVLASFGFFTTKTVPTPPFTENLLKFPG